MEQLDTAVQEAGGGHTTGPDRSARFHRLATVLAEVNEAVYRADQPEQVFRAATSIAVEHGGFVMSWVGLVEPATGVITPVAWAGAGAEEYLQRIRITVDDGPTGRGPTGVAIRTGAPACSNDILSDSVMAPWRGPAQRVGFRSSGAFPLTVDGRVVGCLTAYATEPGYFDDEELDLLQRLAASVSFGWAAIEKAKERVALQMQREQSQRLESLGQLAGGVAHDFNNLLGVILNYATLLERQVQTNQAQADLGEIRAAAERAASLTRQLLDFARPVPLDLVPVDVNDIVRASADMLGRALGPSVHLSTRLHPGALIVNGDLHQLEQVIVNLVINGRDAMPGGGRLTVSTATATTADGSLECRLTVADNGTGMERSVLDRAFEPFFTTKPRGQGTGLGLATVYGIVRRLGGDVVIHSTVGSGTRVVVSLPLVGGHHLPAPAAGQLVARGGTERILVVEDDPALCAATARLLMSNGYEVTSARSATEALARAAGDERGFDLLLTDVRMPGMSGEELARRLTARRPDTRVLLVSGDDLGRHRPAWRLLAKPVEERDLLVALRTELDG